MILNTHQVPYHYILLHKEYKDKTTASFGMLCRDKIRNTSLNVYLCLPQALAQAYQQNSALLRYSGLHVSSTRPPLQLGVACPPGYKQRRAESSYRLSKSKRPEETRPERIHEQPAAATEEPHPPAQSGGERAADSALQAQVKKALTDISNK